jgi:cysteinyl-tRNA synthetase
MDALGVLLPSIAPKATDHVDGMIALIARLVARGIAYVVDGDVYFEIRRFPAYGKLSGRNLDELLAGARVEVDERKRDPRDFALWKAAKPGEPSWPSPWGAGRPGWHIECSVMATRYLGDTFDIHGGGTDLIFPHHECEIAQSEADTGKTFARYWVHNGMVNFGTEKMSKSLGNTLAIREMVKRYDRDALRLWMLGTHYRHQLEWSQQRVEEAGRALARLSRPIEYAAKYKATQTFGQSQHQQLPSELAVFTDRFVEAMDDDFNTPEALGTLFDLSGALLSRELSVQAQIAGTAALQRFAGVLGLLRREFELAPPDVQRLADERAAARAQRDFRRADELRAEIQRLGWLVEDTPEGPRLTRKSG